MSSCLRAFICAGVLLAAACAPIPRGSGGDVALEQDAAVGDRWYPAARQIHGGDLVTDPALLAYVRGVGNDLAGDTGSLPVEFGIVNDSDPVSWSLPGGKIAISRGFLYLLEDEAELAAALAHELGHALARHAARARDGADLEVRDGALGVDHAAYVVGEARHAAVLVQWRHDVASELEADRYALLAMRRAGYDPRALIRLQERLAEARETRPGRHPVSAERLAAAGAAAAELGAGGRTGEAEYAAATRGLSAARPAYEHFDRARLKLLEGNISGALRLADRAIEMEPAEAAFYGLKGDLDFAVGNYQSAIGWYDEAIGRNERYFRFFLGRGEARRLLRQLDDAAADLTISARLLPTADAVAALGRIAEDRGNLDRAIALYRNAASSPTPAGREAVIRLVELDLPRQPDRYVEVGREIDQRGRVYLELVNLAAVPLADIDVVLAYRDGAGRVRQETRAYAGALAPGDTGIIMLDPHYATLLQSLQVKVRTARAVSD